MQIFDCILRGEASGYLSNIKPELQPNEETEKKDMPNLKYFD